VYLLEGIARCASCGSPISIRSATTPGRNRPNAAITPAAYVCRARKLERRGERRCNAPIVPVAELDARVWSVVSDALRGEKLEASLRARAAARASDASDWKADLDGYRKHLARLERVETGVVARFRRGTISEAVFDRELAAITRERSMLATQVDNAQRAAARAAPDEPAAEVVMARLRQLAATKIPEDRRTVVNLLVDPTSVVLDHGVIRMTLVVEAAACRPAAGDGARSAVVPVTAVGSRTHREDMRVILDVVA
jgi:hypothetical protein